MRGFLNVNTFYTITKKVDFFPPWKNALRKYMIVALKKKICLKTLNPRYEGLKG